MRRALAFVLVACSPQPSPPAAPAPAPACKDTPAPPSSVANRSELPEAAPPKTIEKKGRGACREDYECVLTSYDRCCAGGCEPYASSVQELARRQAADSCATSRRECRQPKCAGGSMSAKRAACRDGTCTAIFERNDPGY